MQAGVQACECASLLHGSVPSNSLRRRKCDNHSVLSARRPSSPSQHQDQFIELCTECFVVRVNQRCVKRRHGIAAAARSADGTGECSIGHFARRPLGSVAAIRSIRSSRALGADRAAWITRDSLRAGFALAALDSLRADGSIIAHRSLYPWHALPADWPFIALDSLRTLGATWIACWSLLSRRALGAGRDGVDEGFEALKLAAHLYRHMSPAGNVVMADYPAEVLSPLLPPKSNPKGNR